MVTFSFKSLRPTKYGAIGSLLFLVLFFISLANSVVRGDDEPQLVLAFFGFPTSWLFFSIFHPLLEWMGPFGATSRRIVEWLLLGVAGTVQYWLIGTVVAHLIVGEPRNENNLERNETEPKSGKSD